MIALGTKIRITDNRYNDPVTVGNTYSVIRSEPNTYGGQMPIAVADDNDGSVLWLSNGQFEIVNPVNELQELRAFRDRAIARFPALAEPESDDEAAERFANRSYEIGREDTFLEAFAWARANPR